MRVEVHPFNAWKFCCGKGGLTAASETPLSTRSSTAILANLANLRKLRMKALEGNSVGTGTAAQCEKVVIMIDLVPAGGLQMMIGRIQLTKAFLKVIFQGHINPASVPELQERREV